MPLIYRIRWISLLAASLLAMAASAHAAGIKNMFYFAGYKGLNLQGDQVSSLQSSASSSQGSSFAGVMGFKLDSHWRLESEVSYQSEDLSRVSFHQGEAPPDGRFKSWSGLVNIYYDFDVPGKVEPFVGAGIGYKSDYREQKAGGQDAGNFAWQFGGGLKYMFDPSLSFTGAYRFMDDAGDDFVSYDEDGGHQFRVGVTYKLPVKPRKTPRGIHMMGND